MTACLTTAVDLPLRVSFAADPAGTTFACLRSDASEGLAVEVQTVRRNGGDGEVRIVQPAGLGLSSQLLPIGPDELLLCHHRDGAHLVELVSLSADGHAVRSLGGIVGHPLRLLPAGPLSADGVLALAVTSEPSGRSAVRTVTRDGLADAPLLQLPGLLGGGSWTGTHPVLAGWLTVDGRPADGVLLDLTAGTWTTALRVGPTTSDRFVGGSDQLLVAMTDAGGAQRIGYGPCPAQLRFPEPLASADGDLTVLGCAGRRLLVAADQGARSRLLLVDAGTGSITEVATGPGVPAGPAAMTGDVAVLPWITPTGPATLLRIDVRTAAADAAASAADAVGTALFPGADGPVEAVVHGDPATAEHVVLALHGGPLAAWRLGFDPLLAALAERGVAVVALNQRGSTGYGRDHALAIRNAWGGPDLDDVLSAAEAIRRMRTPGARRPVLLGTSYGGFLALLAAALEPDGWSGCVALSPFISGPRLLEATDGPIRLLLERLGGDVPYRDGRGVRDAYERCPEIETPVLVVHGDLDDVVPVTESRALVARMRAHDRSLDYVELAGAGHELSSGEHRRTVFERVATSAAFA